MRRLKIFGVGFIHKSKRNKYVFQLLPMSVFHGRRAKGANEIKNNDEILNSVSQSSIDRPRLRLLGESLDLRL